jgi:ABC-type transport system substrate-binding protein
LFKTYRRNIIVWLVCCLMLWVSGCGAPPWNNPYPRDEVGRPVFFSSFSERPKFLDPARSYSSNEWAFISQIYEPPLQYHFLKRPYQLVPLTATAMPEVIHYGADGRPLPADADPGRIASSEYRIHIRKGIRYQPHPAFARTGEGGYRYWPLSAGDMDGRYSLDDFPERGTRELTAEDYVYQIKRLAVPANHSPIAGLMAEHIEGFADFAKAARARQAQDRAAGRLWTDLRPLRMRGVRVLDRYTYSIRLKGVYPQFIYWLAMNFFAPMPWEAERFYAQPGMRERNITLNWYPVGTGPFMLTENNPNLRMVLSRNPNFHGEAYPSEGSEAQRKAGLLDDAGKPMPFIEKAVYSLEKEAIPRWNKFLQGYYDNSGIASDSFDQAIQIGANGEASLTPEMRDKGILLDTAVETSIFYLGFNMRDPVVGGRPGDAADQARARKLRQAISIAVDWEEFISIFNNGRGAPAQGPLPPGIFGHRSGREGINPVVYRWQDGRPRRRSIAEAKALLAEAGYPDGVDPKTGKALILYYDTALSGPGSKSLLQWYVNQFKKLGIQLVVRTTDYNRFQEKMLKGAEQIFSWGWNADYPDPENFLFLLYGPNGKVEHHGENAANYHNPEFDRLFDRMKNLPNGPERQALIDRMLEILRQDAPWLFGYFPKGFSLHHAWYHNALPHLMANNTLKYKRIDGGLRARKQEAWNQPVLWPVWVLLGLLALSAIPAIRDYRARERRRAR